jgi:hypothetical protein
MDQLFALGNVSYRKAIFEIAPDDAGYDPPERNPGSAQNAFPDYAALHPGYGTRNDVSARMAD